MWVMGYGVSLVDFVRAFLRFIFSGFFLSILAMRPKMNLFQLTHD
jgi:hypothetical protein